MFKKVKLGSSLAALIIFAFPWVDIKCTGISVATQSGFQVVGGGATASKGMEAMGSDSSIKKAQSANESLGFAPLVALALIAVIGSVIFGFITVFQGSERSDSLSSGLAAVALLLLLIQLMVGFPAKEGMIEAAAKENSEVQAGEDDPGGEMQEFGAEMDEFGAEMDQLGAEMAESMAAAMAANIQVKAATGFYLELLALGIPTFLLVSSLMDKHRKGAQGVAPNT